jgi:hypothetical protein
MSSCEVAGAYSAIKAPRFRDNRVRIHVAAGLFGGHSMPHGIQANGSFAFERTWFGPAAAPEPLEHRGKASWLVEQGSGFTCSSSEATAPLPQLALQCLFASRVPAREQLACHLRRPSTSARGSPGFLSGAMDTSILRPIRRRHRSCPLPAYARKATRTGFFCPMRQLLRLACRRTWVE